MKPIIDEIYKMLDDKPEIKTSEYWPNENGMYSLAGIKRFMEVKGYSTDMTDQAMYQISNSKQKLSCIKILNKKYKEFYPYYYSNLTTEELDNLKSIYES